MTTKQSDKLTALTYEQKLMALALKYYSNIVWIPKEGDYYTTSRNDLELYQIVEANADCIVTKYCDPARGKETTSWAREKFLEGFGVYRVHVPEFVFESCKKKQEQSQSEPIKDEGSIVRNNLMNEQGYAPYCGNDKCSMPRTKFNGEQFVCPECGWVSKFPKDFIDRYKAKWRIEQSHPDKPEWGEEQALMDRVYDAANKNKDVSTWVGVSPIPATYYHFVEGAEWVIENILPEKDARIRELEESLQNIIHPISYLQDEAMKEGVTLDGIMAQQLIRTPSFYIELARKALKAPESETNK